MSGWALRHPPRVGHAGLLTACILLPSGQMCCNPAEMPAGTGRAAGLGLSLLHVSSFTGGDEQKAGSGPKSRGHAPRLLAPSLLKCFLPRLAQKIPGLTVGK